MVAVGSQFILMNGDEMFVTLGVSTLVFDDALRIDLDTARSLLENKVSELDGYEIVPLGEAGI